MKKRLRLVVLGMIGQSPFAGVAWQALHYLEGFRRLGHDVYYVEDTRQWPYDPNKNATTDDCQYTINYLSRILTWCSLPDRWAYRAEAEGGRTYGLSEFQLSRLFEQADALVNLHGATMLREEHLRVAVRIYLETDPVRPQIEVGKAVPRMLTLLGAHTHHFTFAENLGAPDCRVPLGPFKYCPTRQPVVLDWWTSGARPSVDHRSSSPRFTTIANWQQSGNDVEWYGETYAWSKHLEFLKVIELPRRTLQPLELALACSDPDVVQSLTSHGWRVVDGIARSMDILPYRDYIHGSSGEFTVAKDQNVRLRSGWFSDRSACYLAAAKPVITQDTGFGNVLPTGEGLFAFNTMPDILLAIDAINSDYERHSRAARGIAEQYFKAETVLAKIIDAAGL